MRGQRILSRFSLDPFTRMELIRDGIPVFGTVFRHLISPPDRAEIVHAIRRHYEAIRTYGDANARWLLDTARCLYTLKTNQVIAKTKAGEWALEQHLCPNPETMEQALNIRKHPKELLNYASVKKMAEWSETGNPKVCRCAGRCLAIGNFMRKVRLRKNPQDYLT